MRKRRLLSVLVGLSALGIVSLVFGMMMAVASDLPQLENKRQYGKETNSYLYDDQGRPIGIFAPPNHEVIDTFQQLGPTMRHAIVSVEDKRFWTDSGVDIRGTARAFLADVSGGATQGASTIAQQFVKNALAQEGNRTIFEKIREAALAFHLTHRWAKGKILDEYLNSIYFGNGAYGVESAARVYFGKQLGYDPNAGVDGSTTGCGDSTTTVRRPSCASQLNPAQAALLAGMVANPSAFNPLAFPTDAKARRDLVLQDMVSQRYITRAEYERYRNAPLPNAADIEQPQEPPGAPYFTSWLRPQILSAMGLGHGVPASEAEFRAYYGGLKIRTTIDLKMQQAAEHAIAAELPSGPSEPTASLVAIDNRTGEVRAMVGGPLVNGGQDYAKYPFNLATQGHRQPGSAFKPFTLAVALQKGYGPSSVLDSKPLDIRDPRACGQANYRPHNYNDEYVGPTTLAEATAQSDNSVFTQVGLAVGPDNVAKMATAAGIRSPISTNCSMIIGGLTEGVSPLDMAHAYETFAEGGRRVYDPVLGDVDQGPTGIAEIDCAQVKCRGKRKLVDQPHYRQVMPPEVAATIHELLSGVVTHGTGQAAQIPGVDVVGKTGTTNNEGDAWFVGWTPQITTAVWVGFPNKLIPMTSIYNGGPATGGTFPAQIWRSFTEQALQIAAQENAAKPSQSRSSTATGTTPATGTTGSTYTGAATGSTAPSGAGTATGTTPVAPAPTATGTAPAAPAPTGGGAGGTGGGGTTPVTPVTPAPTGGGTGGDRRRHGRRHGRRDGRRGGPAAAAAGRAAGGPAAAGRAAAGPAAAAAGRAAPASVADRVAAMRLDEAIKSRLLASDGDWPAHLRYWTRAVSAATLPLAHRGSRYECPCCSGEFSSFADFRASGVLYPESRCPRCGSLSRQRVLWLYIERETGLLERPIRVLHVAPDYAFYRRLHARPSVDYVAVDLQLSPMVKERVDISDMSFADASFDLVLCSHVLEHVSDDHRALGEMRRVLKPDGVALLQHPIDDLDVTDEDPTVIDPQERLRRWGQTDHVRNYGRDYVARVAAAGFDVDFRAYHDELPELLVARDRLRDDGAASSQDIAVCRPRSAA